MNKPSDLNLTELSDIVERIQAILWVEPVDPCDQEQGQQANPDKEWTSATVEDITQVLEDWELRPLTRERLDHRCPHGMFYTGAGACPFCETNGSLSPLEEFLERNCDSLCCDDPEDRKKLADKLAGFIARLK